MVSPVFLFDGDEAADFLLKKIDSAREDSSIDIRQFYVRKGVMTDEVHRALKKKLQQGTKIYLELDFMFSVSALKVFEDLKSFPNFKMRVVNPPSKDFIEFTSRAYNLKNPDQVIDDVIDSNLESLRASIGGSKIADAVDGLTGKQTPEVLLGAVMKKIISRSSFLDLLKLDLHLRSLSKRFHDKVLRVKTGSQESFIVGGRGWADSFTSGMKGKANLKEGDLQYLDLDLAYEPGGSDGLPAVSYFAGDDFVMAAQEFEKNLVALIDSAKSSIEIYTPYFTPTVKIREALEQRARRGVRVILRTNSLESTDVPAVAIYTIENLAYWTRGLGENFEFHTLEDKKGVCYHGKLVVVDREMVWIGSGNWDFRSFALDSNSFVAADFRNHPVLTTLFTKLADPHYLKWRKWTADEIANGHQILLKALGEAKLNETLKTLRNDNTRIQL